MITPIWQWLRAHVVLLLFLGILVLQGLTAYEVRQLRREIDFPVPPYHRACSVPEPCIVELNSFSLESLRSMRDSWRR